MAFTKRLTIGREITWAEHDANLTEIEYVWTQMVALSGNALAATNFVGEWFALSGSLAIPAATYDAGKFWMLLSNVADVTAHTPGISAVWAELKQSDVVGPSSAVDGYGAVFDGATGKLLKSLGAAPVKKSGDTMTGTLNVDSGGSVLVTGSGGLGYGTGSGGTVTQATSKSTAVTLNKPSGRITMNSAALPTGTWVDFQLNNSVIGASDGLLVNFDFGSLGTVSYQVEAHATTGQARIRVRQDSGISLSEAVVINFQVIKGASS